MCLVQQQAVVIVDSGIGNGLRTATRAWAWALGGLQHDRAVEDRGQWYGQQLKELRYKQRLEQVMLPVATNAGTSNSIGSGSDVA